jgi:hypothetical protein
MDHEVIVVAEDAVALEGLEPLEGSAGRMPSVDASPRKTMRSGFSLLMSSARL